MRVLQQKDAAGPAVRFTPETWLPQLVPLNLLHSYVPDPRIRLPGWLVSETGLKATEKRGGRVGLRGNGGCAHNSDPGARLQGYWRGVIVLESPWYLKVQRSRECPESFGSPGARPSATAEAPRRFVSLLNSLTCDGSDDSTSLPRGLLRSSHDLQQEPQPSQVPTRLPQAAGDWPSRAEHLNTRRYHNH